MDNSDHIAQSMVYEVSQIIERISPSKLIQCSKKYAPWLNENYFQQTTLRDKLHKIAVDSDNPNDWRQYRRQRNFFNT